MNMFQSVIHWAARQIPGRQPGMAPVPFTTLMNLNQPGQSEKVQVGPQNSMTLSAVWAAVRIIAGTIGTLPMHVYAKGKNGERSEVHGDETDPAPTLTKRPNNEMTAVTFWETLMSHVLLHGNAYAEIERDNLGRPIALWPLSPYSVEPKRDEETEEIYYQCIRGDGTILEVDPDYVYHIPGLGFDGLRGYSPVSLARRSLTLAATAEQAGESFFSDGMRPSGYIKFPGSLQDLQKLNVENNIRDKHAGASRFGRNLILYGGMEYASLSISPDDAQFLETRQFQVEEIARWFCVPNHMLRDLRRGTFSNIEIQGTEFVTYTLLYWLTKITQEFERKLLGDGQYAEHITDGLLRGDTLSRYTSYGIGRQWGWLSRNDIRRKENMSPVPGGDDYLTPVNMTAAEEDDEQIPGASSAQVTALIRQTIAEDCEFLARCLEDLSEDSIALYVAHTQIRAKAMALRILAAFPNCGANRASGVAWKHYKSLIDLFETIKAGGPEEARWLAHEWKMSAERTTGFALASMVG